MTLMEIYEAKRRNEMSRYREIYPEIVFGSGMSAFKIDLVANVPKLILNVDRPKAFIMTNINNPDNTPVFIGPSQDVSFESGFPIVAGDPLAFGVSENTELWGIAIVNMTLYIMDMGL
jgi:hypothetical protein